MIFDRAELLLQKPRDSLSLSFRTSLAFTRSLSLSRTSTRVSQINSEAPQHVPRSAPPAEKSSAEIQSYGSDLNDKFQLQRLAHEERGFGTWIMRNGIPISEPAEILAVLEEGSATSSLPMLKVKMTILKPVCGGKQANAMASMRQSVESISREIKMVDPKTGPATANGSACKPLPAAES